MRTYVFFPVLVLFLIGSLPSLLKLFLGASSQALGLCISLVLVLFFYANKLTVLRTVPVPFFFFFL